MSGAMQPSTVVAELAPVAGDPLLDVTKGAQPLIPRGCRRRGRSVGGGTAQQGRTA
jgi:hypothetical protein